MMFWYGDHTSWWGWVLMSFGMVMFWGLLIVGLVLLFRAVGNNTGTVPGTGQGPARPTPEQILAERLARGEIDEPEYRARLDALRGKVNGKVLR